MGKTCIEKLKTWADANGVSMEPGTLTEVDILHGPLCALLNSAGEQECDCEPEFRAREKPGVKAGE